MVDEVACALCNAAGRSAQDACDVETIDIICAARDLVSLWENQNIAGLSRSERNAAIEQARTKLIEVVHEYEAQSRSSKAPTSQNEDSQQGQVHGRP